MTPTARSLKVMRERGYHAEVTEKWIAAVRQRKDLWTFCDVLGLHKETGEIVAVQTTSGSNVAARVKKIADAETLPYVRKAGIRVVVHGWRKGSNGRWVLREVDVS